MNRFSHIESLALFCWYPPSFSVQFRLHLEPLEDPCIVGLLQTQLRAAQYRFWHWLSTSHEIQEEAEQVESLQINIPCYWGEIKEKSACKYSIN